MVGNRAEHYAHLCLFLGCGFVAIGHHAGFYRTVYHTATHTVAQTLWLLEDFLQHEVRESTLLYLPQVHVDSLNLWIQLHVLDIGNLKFLAQTHDGDVAIFQINHLVGIFYNRCGV